MVRSQFQLGPLEEDLYNPCLRNSITLVVVDRSCLMGKLLGKNFCQYLF